jgi:hypothetical protein
MVTEIRKGSAVNIETFRCQDNHLCVGGRPEMPGCQQDARL